VHVDVRLVNQSGKTALTDVVLTIADVTRSLPFPNAPFQAGLDYADKYANAILNKIIARQDVSEDMIKIASFQLDFAPAGARCADRFEMTGTKALIKAVSGTE